MITRWPKIGIEGIEMARLWANRRPTGSWPETAFEEMRTHATLAEISLRTSGLYMALDMLVW
jgi:hypothetical protein